MEWTFSNLQCQFVLIVEKCRQRIQKVWDCSSAGALSNHALGRLAPIESKYSRDFIEQRRRLVSLKVPTLRMQRFHDVDICIMAVQRQTVSRTSRDYLRFSWTVMDQMNCRLSLASWVVSGWLMFVNGLRWSAVQEPGDQCKDRHCHETLYAAFQRQLRLFSELTRVGSSPSYRQPS